MREIEFRYIHSVGDDAEKRLKDLNEVIELLKENNAIFVRIYRGDLTGSVAKFVMDEGVEPQPFHIEHYWERINIVSDNKSIKGKLIWDNKDKKYKRPFDLIDSKDTYIQCLPDYAGETVWKKFDRGDTIKSGLLSHPPADIEGRELGVGDKILFMNLRYGCGGKLSFGKIIEITGTASPERGFEAPIVVVRTIDDPDETTRLHYSHMQTILC